jgi:IrrE N-terminal-like domain
MARTRIINPAVLHPAELLIQELGISHPRDIDVDAIAYDSRVEVRYETLVGCEATLVGFGGKAIATVRAESIRVRQRFSVGHELGHWALHRGQSFRCRVVDPSENLATHQEKEQEADAYAAHLLLPGPIFLPMLAASTTPSFTALRDIASEFEASVLATALRTVGSNAIPAVLTCHEGKNLRWFQFARDVPRRWYLKRELDSDAFAYEAIANGKLERGFRMSSADSWFTNSDADNYEVKEHSLVRGSEVLTLILLGQDMLAAAFDPDAFPKKYNAFGSYIPKSSLKR